jgi:predicted RNase H-like HicB family nuclease
MEREVYLDSDLLESRQRRHIIIYPLEGDSGYIAQCPSLPECQASGESWEETITAIKEAIELWIVSALARGQAIPSDVPIRIELI